MKYLIAGAGAIGAYLGALMSRAGEDVTLFARGPHLRGMQQRGVKVIGSNGDFQVHPRCIGDLRDAGDPDVIILGVKAHGLTALAPELKPLIRENTAVLSTQNGVPWWFFQFGDGPYAGLTLDRVDPGGVIADSIPARTVIGSIVYFATEIAEPGVVRHNEGDRISMGEPDGSRSERVNEIARAFVRAGLRAPITARIRNEIWLKLLGNVAFNPISTLTRSTLGAIARDPDAVQLVRNIMEEVEAVGNKLNIELPISIDQRIAGAAKVGEHKTSMLQDLEAGRPLELEAIAGAVVELAQRVGVPAPHTRSVYACTKLLESTLLKTDPQVRIAENSPVLETRI